MALHLHIGFPKASEARTEDILKEFGYNWFEAKAEASV